MKKLKNNILIQNSKLISKCVNYNIKLVKLEDVIEERDEEIKKLRNIIFETSSNNEYLIEQKKKYNKINKELRVKINELENKKLNPSLEKHIKSYLKRNKNENISLEYEDMYEIYKIIYGEKI